MSKRRRDYERLRPDDRLGDAPIADERLHRMMTRVMQAMDAGFNPGLSGGERKVGIVLMTFPYNDHSGHCNFASNGADRRDLVVLFKEMIARFEGQPEIEGNA